jgi:hypothetical protein
MEIKEKIQQLAETLKNSGLAASMEDALEKARNIVTLGGAKEKDLDKIERPEDILKIEKQKTLIDINEEDVIKEDTPISELIKEEVISDEDNVENEDSEESSEKKEE